MEKKDWHFGLKRKSYLSSRINRKESIDVIIIRSMVQTSKPILKTKLFFLWIFLITLILWMFTYYSLSVLKEVSSVQYHPLAYQNSGYFIKTPGCRIPEMYVNGPFIDKYMQFDEKLLNCKSTLNYTLPLVTSNLTSLIVNIKVLATLNITTANPTFKCYYSPIERLAPNLKNPKEYDENSLQLDEKIYFNSSITVPHEMVEVICTLNDKIIYTDYHIFVRPIPTVMKRKYRDVSVLVLGLDAVSRLNFHRQMPKTNAFLSLLGNVEMLGYNKVEDNTFPNLVPVLSGLSVDEFKNKCWPNTQDFFDNCHFIWNDFKNSNFSTAFMEDSPMIGMFNYLKRGFFNKPTDHYLRPIMLRSESKIGNGYHSNTVSCIGDQLGMTVLFNHAFKFASSMINHLYMAFVWSSSLTHDFIAFPRYGDNDLRTFFDKFNRSGQLNHTVVILMSDHGIRWGSFRDTPQGGLEDRLPMLRFIIPEWFKNTYVKAIKNLNLNTVRLTTPYDLHETLLDLIDTRRLTDDSIERRTKSDQNKRGMSLFLEISKYKTCDTAGIPKHYCACHNNRTTIDVNDVDVINVATFLIQYVNLNLSVYPMCANLTLLQIHKATVESGRYKTSIRDYEIQVTTVPGYAKFESTIRDNNGQLKTVGSISRLNLYGNQSICVNDTKIKLLCYCIN